jgi:hypothetical protein
VWELTVQYFEFTLNYLNQILVQVAKACRSGKKLNPSSPIEKLFDWKASWHCGALWALQPDGVFEQGNPVD